jgi:hypothetical protein
LEEIRATYQLNTEKLDYNYRVLTELDVEKNAELARYKVGVCSAYHDGDDDDDVAYDDDGDDDDDQDDDDDDQDDDLDDEEEDDDHDARMKKMVMIRDEVDDAYDAVQ